MNAMNGTHGRDVSLERRWTTQAAEAAGVSAETLNEFAERRAGQGPVLEIASRNFAREVVEELADARNYLVWWAQQLAAAGSQDELAGEVTQAIGEALAHVTVAFEAAHRGRRLQAEWKAGST